MPYTFIHKNWFFELKTPEYEAPVFGFRVGELRIINKSESKTEALPFSEIINYLKEKDIKICTFRGQEDIGVIRLLENTGFRFISTYNNVECKEEDFIEIKTDKQHKISIAKEEEYDEILEIEKMVKDFSTFSIDPFIDEKSAALRNALRVKSHFSKENHRIYVVRKEDKIAGFIQFVLDYPNKTAYTLNAAISPEFQKEKIGKGLFSESFKDVFRQGCTIIKSDYGTQNIGSAKLHKMCNFKIVNQEIHLRLFL